MYRKQGKKHDYLSIHRFRLLVLLKPTETNDLDIYDIWSDSCFDNRHGNFVVLRLVIDSVTVSCDYLF